MRGAGGGGAAGRAAIGAAGGAFAEITGGAAAAGTCAAGGGITGSAGGALTSDGVTGEAAAGGATTGGATTGRGGATGTAGGAATEAGGAAAAGFAAGGGVTVVGRLTPAGNATAGFSAGACVTGGATRRGAAGGATASLRCVIAFNTSPGREMCDRSILVLISSSPRSVRELDLPAGDEPSAEERIYTRTFSASCSSRELECVFFSVTPTSASVSRMALLLTSSSRARSLIRTLLIRPFVSPCCKLGHHSTSRSQFLRSHAVALMPAGHNYSLVSEADSASGAGCSSECSACP
jgi:hypothetical protein